MTSSPSLSRVASKVTVGVNPDVTSSTPVTWYPKVHFLVAFGASLAYRQFFAAPTATSLMFDVRG